MQAADYEVRRANLEDLPILLQVWEKLGFPAQDLKERFTEFQVVTDASGNLLASLGLQVQDQQGRLHHEGMLVEEAEEELRALLWKRVHNLARNLGLHRLWIQSGGAFWEAQGFRLAHPEGLTRLPQQFGSPQAEWWVLQLKDESLLTMNVEQQLVAYQLAERERLNQMMDKAKTAKTTALWVMFLVLAGFAVYAVMVLIRSKMGQ